MEGENELQQMLWLIFRDTPNGPPTFWVPPRLSPSPVPPSSESKMPTSLQKGEGQLRQQPLTSRELRHWWSGPHPSEQGRGSYLCHCMSFGVKGGGEGEGWWQKDEREWAKINCDGVDGRLKLQSPSQITFDMNACKSDSQIKICIIL